jgi:division protein CdvB (Snf7/Vps24/ESCRT-III family)
MLMVQVYKDITKVQKDAKRVAEIADIIRHAKTGTDVREAMAQGFETIDDSEVVNHLIDDVDKLTDEIIGYRADVKNLTETVQKSITDNQTGIENIGKQNQEAIQKVLDDNQSKLNMFNEDWQNKINRIILGIDEPTLEKIIDAKLNERGV